MKYLLLIILFFPYQIAAGKVTYACKQKYDPIAKTWRKYDCGYYEIDIYQCQTNTQFYFNRGTQNYDLHIWCPPKDKKDDELVIPENVG